MARTPNADAIYDVAELFRQRCIVGDRSLLWPDERAWTVSNLQNFWDAFVGQPDDSSKSFMEKWADQLAGQSDNVIRIAADITAFYGLFPVKQSLGSATKANLVRQVMALLPELGAPDPST